MFICISVECDTHFFEELDVTSSLSIVSGVFVVDVETIETVVLQEFEGALNELCTQSRIDNDWMERG